MIRRKAFPLSLSKKIVTLEAETAPTIAFLWIHLISDNVLGLKVAQEYERIVMFRLGKLLAGGARGPGLFFILPCIDSYRKIDLRTVTYDVPPQEILSKDSVTVSVDAVAYFRTSSKSKTVLK